MWEIFCEFFPKKRAGGTGPAEKEFSLRGGGGDYPRLDISIFQATLKRGGAGARKEKLRKDCLRIALEGRGKVLLPNPTLGRFK